MPQKPWERDWSQPVTATAAKPWEQDWNQTAPKEDIASIKAAQAAKYPSAQELGVPIGTDLRSLPQRIMAAVSGETMKEQNPGLLAEPVLTGVVPMAEGVGALQAIKSLLPSSILPGSIPSAANAGLKFDQVMAKAKDIPIDLAEANKAVERAVELRQAGSTMPKIFRDFIKAQEANPTMTYQVGRDFASNASALSTREITALNAKMQRQVATFADALKTANREAAEKAGMGNLYDAAIKEYKKAKELAEFGDKLKQAAKVAGKAGLVGAAGTTAGAIIYDLLK